MAMTVANFSGAEAEELRRAVGMRRSWERMENLEGKLRTGMTANGIAPKVQETIIENISSFALYGFPESHAASFALIAYASAYFKVKYLAAFTCCHSEQSTYGLLHACSAGERRAAAWAASEADRRTGIRLALCNRARASWRTLSSFGPWLCKGSSEASSRCARMLAYQVTARFVPLRTYAACPTPEAERTRSACADRRSQ